jgi:hypothetical protein
MIDLLDVQMTAATSSMKILAEGTGTFTIPAIPVLGAEQGTATIPHGYGSDELLFQVGVTLNTTENMMIPWQSNDGRVCLWASLDDTNLVIYGEHNELITPGATPAKTVDYYYRIFIP